MRAIPFFLLSLFLVLLSGCGGGGGVDNDGEGDIIITPVTITISPTNVSLEVGDTQKFASEVNRTDFSVKWYVNNIENGNAIVGTVDYFGLYTAPNSVPNPGTVTVKAIPAADISKSATARVAVTEKLSISPTRVIVPAKQTLQFTANKPASWLVNDVAGGNATIGTISSAGLYKAPDSIPSPDSVTIKAAWTDNPAKTASASVTITTESSVSISPTVVTVAAGATQQFNANVDVNWEVSGAAGEDRPLGTIDDTGRYTAPAAPPRSGMAIVTAISRADPTQKAIAMISIAFSNASLNGHYAIRFRGAQSTGPYFVIGSFIADGMGEISNGVYDMNDLVFPIVNSSFKATYTIGEDGRGVLNIAVGMNQITWRLAMLNADSGRLIAFGDGDSGSGSFERQDAESFAAGLSGPFAFSHEGITPGNKPFAAAGMFTVGGGGGIGNGLQDINDNGTAQGNVNFTGSISGVDITTGRGIMSFTIGSQTTNYAYYMLSSEAFVYSSGMENLGLIGLASRQSGGPFSSASLPGDSIFMFKGGSPANPPTPAFGLGRFSSDGKGTLLNGVQDVNTFGGKGVNIPFTGTYTIDANGHGFASLVRSNATDNLTLYMIEPGKAFFVTRDPWVAAGGQIIPQIGVPFTAGVIHGTFGFGLHGEQTNMGLNISGQFSMDGDSGTITGTADSMVAGGQFEGDAVVGSFTVSANGRGGATLDIGGVPAHLAIYLSDSDNIFLIENEPALPDKLGMAAKQFEK